jgi:hypothetical protein
VKFVKDKSFVLLEAMETLLGEFLRRVKEVKVRAGWNGGTGKEHAPLMITQT